LNPLAVLPERLIKPVRRKDLKISDCRVFSLEKIPTRLPLIKLLQCMEDKRLNAPQAYHPLFVWWAVHL